MKRTVIIVSAIITILTITALFHGCEKDDTEQVLIPKSFDLTEKAGQVIYSSNDFGIELFSKVAEEETDNLMLSPLSASTALTMLLNGCSGNTYLQNMETLKYPEGMTLDEINESYNSLVNQLLEADSKVQLALANAIFYRNGFNVKNEFLNSMQASFDALIKSLDFSSPSALDEINGWASDNTNGKIEEVLQQISAEAVMFIMNALYFKGDWSYKFDETLTEDNIFYPDGTDPVMVSTMRGEVGAKIYTSDDYRAIELPYGRTNFTMIVIVPEGSLSEFNSSFNINEWNNLTGDLDSQEEYGNLEVFMPGFKFSYEKYLNNQLKSMGMADAFNPYLADLSGISESQIYVDFVKQNSFIEVNEEGTEAAAVTTIGVDFTSVPAQPFVFKIDKSFVFAIRERTTNTILFLGQVLNPENE